MANIFEEAESDVFSWLKPVLKQEATTLDADFQAEFPTIEAEYAEVGGEAVPFIVGKVNTLVAKYPLLAMVAGPLTAAATPYLNNLVAQGTTKVSSLLAGVQTKIAAYIATF